MSDVVFALKEYSNKGYRHVTNDYSVISAKIRAWCGRHWITEKYLNKVRDLRKFSRRDEIFQLYTISAGNNGEGVIKRFIALLNN